MVVETDLSLYSSSGLITIILKQNLLFTQNWESQPVETVMEFYHNSPRTHIKMAVGIRNGNYDPVNFSLMDTDLAFPLAPGVFTILKGTVHLKGLQE